MAVAFVATEEKRMSAPNLISINTITGKTVTQDVTTVPATLLSNAVASSTVTKINSLYIANSSSSVDSRITVNFIRGSTSVTIAKNSLVPLGNTLIVIAKDASVYLEEGDSLQISSSTNNALTALISYEVIG